MNTLRIKLLFALAAMLVWSLGSAAPAACQKSATLPANVCAQYNVAYGSGPLQNFNVYMSTSQRQNAPVIFMVHGGGWYQGDKADTTVVQNKMKLWVPAGFIFISVDYPLMPGANPLQQATNVAQALAYAQQHVTDWGGNPNKFILMGFSAGGQLISLIAAEPSLATSLGASPWLGTVALDAGVYDVPKMMANPNHPTIYNQAFGTNSALWNAASPYEQLQSRIAPFMAVCSTQETNLCGSQDKAFTDKAKSLGTETRLLQVDLSHGEINADLGLQSDYTNQVNTFIIALINGASQ